MSGKILQFSPSAPSVSIVISLYNKVDYITQTLLSACNQSYPDYEVVVVNDGSTDGSDIVAQKFPVRFLSVSNRGQAAARNAGVMASRGDYILPLDADDLIHPEYLSKTVPLMTEGVAIVSVDMQRFGTQDQLVPAQILTYEQEREYNDIPVCSLIRREAFIQCGGYNSRVTGYEDWALWVDILSRGWKMAVVNEPLFFYRTGCNTANTEADKRRAEFTKLIHEWHPSTK